MLLNSVAMQRGYLNGVEDGGIGGWREPAMHNSPDGLFIGACVSSGSVGYGMVGGLDEIRLWSRERGLNEIRSTMRRPVSHTEPGLVEYWDCNQPSLYRLEGNHHTGELVGVPRFDTSGVPFGPTGSTMPAQRITSTSAELRGEVTAWGATTQAWFEWGGGVKGSVPNGS